MQSGVYAELQETHAPNADYLNVIKVIQNIEKRVLGVNKLSNSNNLNP